MPAGDRGALPRRTEQTARQRAIARDWVLHRYVPDPVALGLPIVSFVLAQPFTERSEELARLWVGSPFCIAAWAASERLFGAFLAPSIEAATRRDAALTPAQMVHALSVLRADARLGAVPVYFDFEGAWSRFAALGAPLAYPHPLPPQLRASPSVGPVRLSSGEQETVVRLVHRPFEYRQSGSGGGVLSGVRERRALASGLVERRYFLNPVAVSRWIAGFPESVAFVHGDFTPESRPSDLFRELVTSGEITPFLFAFGQGRVLIGTLSRQRVRPRPATARPERNVLAILEPYLRNIQVDRLPLAAITPAKQHVFVDLLRESADGPRDC
ncbi:MAG: hypothetical protein L3K18_06880 [Thermoplasmata archaeon]|nr:hypothetical protein [Thermoplasmata archaeon]